MLYVPYANESTANFAATLVLSPGSSDWKLMDAAKPVGGFSLPTVMSTTPSPVGLPPVLVIVTVMMRPGEMPRASRHQSPRRKLEVRLRVVKPALGSTAGALASSGWFLIVIGRSTSCSWKLVPTSTTHGHGAGGAPTMICPAKLWFAPMPNPRVPVSSQSVVPLTAALPHTCTVTLPWGQFVPCTIILSPTLHVVRTIVAAGAGGPGGTVADAGATPIAIAIATSRTGRQDLIITAVLALAPVCQDGVNHLSA